MTVYFIGGDVGPIKIGYTDSVAKRLGALQTGNGQELRILAVIPGDYGTEARVHAKFKANRIRGEWFSRSPELLEFIRKVACLHWENVKAAHLSKEEKDIDRVLREYDEARMQVEAINGRREKDNRRREAIRSSKILDAIVRARPLRPPSRGRAY